ncbi:hypothetical protein ACH5RR_039455 [Cinchona calisaya]|uniref:Uncharacterized protein n=1 Tax=Cinchona calisaya TaxID=153742 RepID=A0ABD2Y1Q8_9GENT
MASASGQGFNNGNTLSGEALAFNLGTVMLVEDTQKKVIRRVCKVNKPSTFDQPILGTKTIISSGLGGINSSPQSALEPISSLHEERTKQLVSRKRKTPISLSQGEKVIVLLEIDVIGEYLNLWWLREPTLLLI